MIRLSVEELNFPKYDDENVISAWTWIRSFMSDKDWEKRKSTIEQKIVLKFRDTPPFSEPLTEGTLMNIKDDVIGWYLYLVDMIINEPHKYEFFQGARILPIFKRLGMDLELLKKIEGIDSKIKSLIKKRRSEADALLFEILTALLWARNGYKVSFLDEKGNMKTPDLVAEKDGETFNIECKRQSKTSDYTYRETAKRQKMVSYISKILMTKSLLLDIVFHVELESLPDTYLFDLLVDKLKSPIAGKIISNHEVDITLSFVDITQIIKHLKTHFVKNHSPMLNYLIGRRPVDNKGFTCGIYANFYRVGDGEINNLYISDLSHAYGVYWDCDAKEALWKKARDIRSQINAAMKQFSQENTAVIHIGLETFDGPKVEMTRFEKIQNTIENINPLETNLRWIFCNFFQAYSPHNEYWIFDETQTTLTAYEKPILPIDSTLMIVPEDGNIENNISHWERPLPY